MLGKTEAFDVAIIGGGIVSLSAAVYCGRLNLKTVVIGSESGGTLAKTNIVENYPGFISITGIGLTNKVLEHAKQYNNKIFQGVVEKVTWNRRSCFKVRTKKKDFHAKAIIFATGSKWRKLGVPGEEEFTNKGVHYCALCDGPVYKNKIVFVTGGGDSAVKEALLLSQFAKEVYVLARSKLKPEPINMQRMNANKKIKSFEGVQIKEIKGTKFVESVVLNKKLGESNVLKADAVFVDVGHVPLSTLAIPLGVKVNKNKEIIINKESKTNIIGIYAAGDVTDTKSKQAITGVGEAVKAVYSIYEYLNNEKILCGNVDER